MRKSIVEEVVEGIKLSANTLAEKVYKEAMDVMLRLDVQTSLEANLTNLLNGLNARSRDNSLSGTWYVYGAPNFDNYVQMMGPRDYYGDAHAIHNQSIAGFHIP